MQEQAVAAGSNALAGAKDPEASKTAGPSAGSTAPKPGSTLNFEYRPQRLDKDHAEAAENMYATVNAPPQLRPGL